MATPDAVLQGGNAAVGSDFEALSFKPDKIHHRGLNNVGLVVSDLVPISNDFLAPAEFQKLADVPPEMEWLANITNLKTRL